MFFRSREKATWERPGKQQPTEKKAEQMRPPVPPPPPAKKSSDLRDYYRVGFDINSMMVTLTLLNGSTSMTLSLSDSEVEHLTRMLQAARRRSPENGN